MWRSGRTSWESRPEARCSSINGPLSGGVALCRRWFLKRGAWDHRRHPGVASWHRWAPRDSSASMVKKPLGDQGWIERPAQGVPATITRSSTWASGTANEILAWQLVPTVLHELETRRNGCKSRGQPLRAVRGSHRCLPSSIEGASVCRGRAQPRPLLGLRPGHPGPVGRESQEDATRRGCAELPIPCSMPSATCSC